MLKTILSDKFRAVTILAVIVLSSFASSCTSSKSGAKSVDLSTNLVLSGRITDISNSPVQNAQVFIGTSASAQAQTGQDGKFSITLSESELSKAINETGESVQRLFVATLANAPIRQIGLSEPIDLRLRGNQEIGEIALGLPATLKGNVLSQDLGQKSKPVTGAVVKIGRARSVTLADGSFEITDLPAGKLLATANANNLQSTSVNVSLNSGETLTLETPIVLFAGNVIAGIIQPLPPGDLHALGQAGHPYQRSFRIYKSTRAKFIRYSASEDLFTDGNSLIWKEIQDVMVFDFPKGGGQKLFVQFADKVDGEKSEIYHVTFVIDPFSVSRGFTIEDGSGIVRRRNVTLNVDVPANAWRMRVTSKEDDLSSAVPQVPAPVVQYTFPQIFGTGGLEANGFYDLFMQFEDAQGLKSEVFRSSTYLEVFARTNDVFKINDGAPTTPFKTVKLNVNVPPAARKMRIFETSPSVGGGGGGGVGQFQLTLEAAPEIFFTLAGVGTRTIYLQFLDIESAVSPVYNQLIRVDGNGAAGFNILGGGVSLTKAIEIELIAPPHVSSYRIFDTIAESFTSPWRAIVPQVTYVVPLFGMRTIYVQYQTVDGDILDAIVRTVYIDPFPPATYGFTFAPGTVEVLPDALLGSQLLTRSQIVPLLITPPQGAYEMIVREGNFNNFGDLEGRHPVTVNGNGEPIPTAFDIALTSFVGLKTINVRFISVDGQLSPVVTQHIYYNPFFAPPTRVSISDGALTTSLNLVTVNLYLGAIPTSQQLYVRMAESNSFLSEVPWEAITSSTKEFTLGNDLGLHTIRVQFKLGNTESEIFTDSIELVP